MYIPVFIVQLFNKNRILEGNTVFVVFELTEEIILLYLSRSQLCPQIGKILQFCVFITSLPSDSSTFAIFERV